MSYSTGQDWATAGWNKSRSNGRIGGESKEQALNRARRVGAGVETQARYHGTSNKSAHNKTDVNMRKLDEDTENYKHEHVNRSFSQALQKARLEKKMNQKTLATMINEKPQVIAEYESGKAIPNNQIIMKIERALGTKLPRGKKPAKK